MVIAYNRVILQGRLYNQEVFSYGFSFSGIGGSTSGAALTNYTAMAEWAQDIFDYLDSLPNTNMIRRTLSLAGQIDTVRIEARADNDVLQVAESIGTPISTNYSPSKAPQTAMVASLLTGRPGRSYRGRAYLPALSVDLETATGRVASATATAVATDVADLLNQIVTLAPELDPGVDWYPVVASVTQQVVTPVTAVSVGDVLDTQRRRRDAMIENYTTVTL